jgi:hypothetical protein
MSPFFPPFLSALSFPPFLSPDANSPRRGGPQRVREIRIRTAVDVTDAHRGSIFFPRTSPLG